MLEGIDPVVVIHLKKNVTPATTKLNAVPTPSESQSFLDLPLIPIYLSRRMTGIIIKGEEKNVDIETNTETTEEGGTPSQNQKGLNNSVRVSLQCDSESIGMTLLNALIDQVFEKLTSREYSITYIHGSVTMFNALLASYAVARSSDNTLLSITMELTRSTVKSEAPKSSQPTVSNSVSGSSLGPAR